MLVGWVAVVQGVARAIVNAAALVTTSDPVVSVTSRRPSAASTAIETLTVAVVGLCTTTPFTVTPADRKSVVEGKRKDVDCPVTATTRVCPCWPLAGLIQR